MPFPRLEDQDPITYQELLLHERERKRYQSALIRHPDPRDPDYPGDSEESQVE